MLVLTRKVGERISIGNDITIVVTRIAGNRVTIGVEAPADVRIVRGELERYEQEFRVEADEPKHVPVPASVFANDMTVSFVPRTAR